MIEETGIDGVTVARGCIGNPWIFAQAKALSEGLTLPAPPSLFEQRRVLRLHWELAEKLYGNERAGTHMRKFGIKYSASHPRYLEVRQAFSQVRGGGDWEKVLTDFYAEDPPRSLPTPRGSSGARFQLCRLLWVGKRILAGKRCKGSIFTISFRQGIFMEISSFPVSSVVGLRSPYLFTKEWQSHGSIAHALIASYSDVPKVGFHWVLHWSWGSRIDFLGNHSGGVWTGACLYRFEAVW